jgi:predicted dehydrogenase
MNRLTTRRIAIARSAAGMSALSTATLAGSAPFAATGTASDEAKKSAPSNKIRLAVIGCGGRGKDHIAGFGKQSGVEIVAVCDPDQKRIDAAIAQVEKIGKRPLGVRDMRQIFDDRSIDAVTIATTNHWHAPAAIAACQSGKHAYVEKPISHNPAEGEWLTAVAEKTKRIVGMGNQRRSWKGVIDAIDEVKRGAIGRVYLASAWYTNDRGSIGKAKPEEPPGELDFDLWQGPAPREPYRQNILHYNWHWFWTWGNGELGNNGVHMIDLCRWGLGVDFPTRVSSTGGRYRFDDDQQSPDVNTVTYDFANKTSIVWTGLSCNRTPAGSTPDVLFQGDNGSLAIRGHGYIVYDSAGKKIRESTKPEHFDRDHMKNFVDALRGEAKLTSNVVEGHKSTLLCHLGNAAYRTSRTLTCDPANGHIVGDAEATKLWSREYDDRFKPII